MITHIWDADYPWDVRVEKISRALRGAGYPLHIVARNRARRPLVEHLEEGSVHRMRPLPVPPALDALTQFPAFFNPRWVGLIRRVVRASGSRVVLCRDLPLAPAAIWVGRSEKVPVVLDMAEDYPAMIEDLWRWGKPRPLDFLVRNDRLAARVERWVLRRIAHVLVVVEESRERLVKLGVEPERITVVSNTPPLAQVRLRPGPTPRGSDVLRLVYVGGLDSPMRGIAPLIEAVAVCLGRGVKVSLSLIGDGNERSELESLVARIALPDAAVDFIGRLPHAAAIERLPTFDVGVVPHIPSRHTGTTVPNKLFDYMAAGLAVVVSPAAPLRRIVEDSRCGAVAESLEPNALADAIASLADEQVRWRCAAAAWRAGLEVFHWEQDERRLVGMFRELVGDSGIDGSAPPSDDSRSLGPAYVRRPSQLS